MACAVNNMGLAEQLIDALVRGNDAWLKENLAGHEEVMMFSDAVRCLRQ